MKRIFLAVFLLLISCAQLNPAPTATNAPAPEPATPLPIPTATRVAPPASAAPLPTPANANALTITASDGVKISAVYYPPIVNGAPAILLVHQVGGSKSDWDTFAKQLQKMGYAAMAIDLRGHGATGGTANWAKAPDDVRAAYNVLVARPEVDSLRTAIIGASIGSNLALMVGASEPKVSAVIALSPGLDYLGVNPTASMRNFANRPVLLVASQGDTYSYDSAKSLAQLAIAAEPRVLSGATHGTDMLSEPSLTPVLIEWLNKYVRDLKQ